MNIGIIGAGIAGLAAGRELARAGHRVSVFEKSRGYGGRMATRRVDTGDGIRVDHGLPYLTAHDPEMIAFAEELLGKQVLIKWDGDFSRFGSDGRFFPVDPRAEKENRYIAPKGMNEIGKYLGRWTDVYFGERIGGITRVSHSDSPKSAWMINASSISVFEADAIIIATPAVQAYGLVSTAQDEREVRRIITLLHDITYSSAWSFMAGYESGHPEIQMAAKCDHKVLNWICNESSKKRSVHSTVLVTHTTHDFTVESRLSVTKQDIEYHIREALGEIMGSWAVRPNWSQLHYWKYKQPLNFLEMPFLESADEDAPLALAGDYFMGRSAEAAYLSGLRLGRHWSEKFAQPSKSHQLAYSQ